MTEQRRTDIRRAWLSGQILATEGLSQLRHRYALAAQMEAPYPTGAVAALTDLALTSRWWAELDREKGRLPASDEALRRDLMRRACELAARPKRRTKR